jgi:hypothetical protein
VRLRRPVSSIGLCYDLIVLGRNQGKHEVSTSEGRRFFLGPVAMLGVMRETGGCLSGPYDCNYLSIEVSIGATAI